MEEVVVLEALRTPIGRIRGALSSVRPDDMLAGIFKALREARPEAGPHGEHVDEVFAGCANQGGEDNRNVARMSWLLSGGDQSVPAVTVNRLCASGLEAVIQGYRAIATGTHKVVVAGGVESMSRAPLVMGKPDRPFANGNRTVFDTSLGWRFPNPAMEKLFPLEAMGETAENIADKTGIARAEQDAFALQSHQRAVAAAAEGRFSREIAPVKVRTRKGDIGDIRVEQDEGPRADTDIDRLASLRAVFREGGSVTPGNSSSLNDGAAGLILASGTWAREQGLEPLARIVTAASAGVDPRTMGLGPIPATEKALSQSGWSVEDLELVELNEAFAVQALAVMRELGLDQSMVNVNGGAIALGHPLGCSGARILTTLIHEMHRRGLKRGMASLCVGVGQGSSLLVEVD